MSSIARGDSYSFASDPRAAPAKRALFRDGTANVAPANIMFDPRIKRGNTYGCRIVLKSELGSSSASRKPRSYIPPQKKTVFDVQPPKRNSEPIDFSQYLVEATESKDEVDVAAQTDIFAAKAPSPRFQPQKVGIDAATQIEPEDRLFNFDREVEPILDVLVCKTLEQSLLEVSEEHELLSLADKRENLHADQRADARAIREMEVVEMDRQKQKNIVLAQARLRRRQEVQSVRKVAASRQGAAVARGAMQAVWASLRREGYFSDPVETEVTQTFLPWLYAEVGRRMDQRRTAVALVDDLLDGSISRAQSMQLEKAQERRQRMLRIFIKAQDDSGNTVKLGPVVVDRLDSVATVELKLQEYLSANPPPSQYKVSLPSGQALRLGSAASSAGALDRDQTLLAAAAAGGGRLELSNSASVPES